MKRTKVTLAYSAVALLAVAALAGVWLAGDEALAEDKNSESFQVAALVTELSDMNQQGLLEMEAIDVEPFAVPPDSVDVMRARISETYHVDGIGEDTVELSGWVAIKHFNARPVDGSSELSWNTAMMDTEFIGLELSGHSETFGPVEVRLDDSRRVRGQVGQFDLPEKADRILMASTETSTDTSTTDSSTTDDSDSDLTATTDDELAACEAQVNVAVVMPDLDLEMVTEKPVHWFSRVTTIPPVGQTASIAINPVALMSEGRPVGQLVSGKVHFREVVRQLYLTPPVDAEPEVEIASK